MRRPYDPLAVPKPDPGFKYYWGATDIRSPDNIGSLKARGYEVVRDVEAEKLGFDNASLADGGLVDKLNHRISTNDLVLMKQRWETFFQRQRDEMADRLSVVGKKLSEFERNAERIGALLEA